VSQFSMPGIPANMDPTFALDMAAALREQAKALRSSPDAGYETISYKVRRGGIAGFFGATKTVSERRLKAGAQQLLDNAAMFEQQASYFDSLSKSLTSMRDREQALEDQATAEEEAALGIQKPVSEGGQQYTRNDLTRPANNNRLAILLGYDDRENNTSGISINSGGTLGGLRIPTGT
jgi:hypothetical protein